MSLAGGNMKYAVVAAVGMLLSLGAETSALAACSGGLGSTTLSCDSTSGTLSDYKTWIENVYIPAAIEKAMSTYKDTAFDPNTLGQAGYSQIIDTWGTNSSFSQFRSDFWWSPQQQTTVTTTKAASSFLIDGLAWSNAANIYVDINWTGTIADTVAGITNYLGTYTYSYTGRAWGQALLDGTMSWPAQDVVGNGSGTYAFTNNVTAVPGPEAGAGLGALAMLGLGYWARKRRSTGAKIA